MNRLFVSMLLLLASPLVAAQTDIRINAAEVVGWGIFESSFSERKTGFTQSTLPADGVRGVQFVDFTNEIPGEVGVNFGFQYVVNTTPKGQTLQVTNVIKFPGEGLRAPGGRVYTESRENVEIIIGRKAFYGYGFDESWEVVPGEWTFEVWHKNAKLVRKTFTVVGAAEE